MMEIETSGVIFATLLTSEVGFVLVEPIGELSFASGYFTNNTRLIAAIPLAFILANTLSVFVAPFGCTQRQHAT